MSEPEFVIYLDPVSGETMKCPVWTTSMPNLTRGPYYGDHGEYYITMVRVWPPAQQEQEE